MKESNYKPKLVYPLEIYLEHLTTINGIPLTQREIDIIACLLNANSRTRQHIANFLSIALKTVNSHINKLTGKFGYGIDNMMTLLENSDRLSVLKEYYLSLRVGWSL